MAAATCCLVDAARDFVPVSFRVQRFTVGELVVSADSF